MRESELFGTVVLSIIVPVVILAVPVVTAPVDGTAKVVALLVPAFIALLIALILWWFTGIISSEKPLKSQSR